MIGLALPFTFDPARLRADLAAVAESDWSPHYNDRDFGGIWRGAALRSASGDAANLIAVASAFHDTPLLARCPYFREILGAFACPLKSVRLLSLEPGAFIREHTDDALDFEDGEVRLHIPVQTNPAVEFYVSGERLLFTEGGAYYVNVNLPHRVSNRGGAPRIHLVIDAEVNDWLRDLFARSSDVPRIAASPCGVEAFRDAALADSRLHDTLAAIAGSAAFQTAAVQLGRDAGFDFEANDVDVMLRGNPRPGPPGGLPIAVTLRDESAFVEWIDAAARPLTEPFFDETVRDALRNPYLRFSRREAPLAPLDSATAPAGFIFHMSRCGSTLTGRTLAAAGYRVISEAPPVDTIVQSGRADWLRWIVEALGAGMPYVVKLDAWHVHALPLFRAAFPDTPWVFLYRDPVEVLVSHARSPGRHVLPGALDPRALAMSPADITDVPRHEWPAQVLARICDSALRHRDHRALFVDYRDLPTAIWTRIAPHFNIPADIHQMRAAARFDAKRPETEFTSDTLAKQAEGAAFDPILRQYGLGSLYRELRVSSAFSASPR